MSNSDTEDGENYDVKFDEHDDFNSWWAEYWDKLLRQLGVKDDSEDD